MVTAQNAIVPARSPIGDVGQAIRGNMHFASGVVLVIGMVFPE
jgi:hypothetical protein